MSAERCMICGRPLGPNAIRVRYENRVYVFDGLRCKMAFSENPDRYLDAAGGVLDEPR